MDNIFATTDGKLWVYQSGCWSLQQNFVHSTSCAMREPAPLDAKCSCDGDEVERVARAMVVARGYDPDQIASCESPSRIDTPYARVTCAPMYPAPLWTFFRNAAEAAIKALRA